MKTDFDSATLRELAGDPVFERGAAYAGEQRVKGIKQTDDVITATVSGTRRYRVRLALRGEEVSAACDCPAALEAEWCKHAVAVALEWLDQDEDKPRQARRKGRSADDLRAYLLSKDKVELVGLLAELADGDDHIRDRLWLDAAVGPNAVDLRAFRRTIARTIRPRTFVDYHNMYDYTHRIDTVVDQIERLLTGGRVHEVIDLTDFALEAMEDALGAVDDSDGGMSPILERLQDLHRRACRRARPDPKVLAARLFAWEMRTDWEIFLGAAAAYADVLGPAGLAAYRELADREWAHVPALGPTEEDPERCGKRFRITHVMEALARASGDVEALVAVKSRDLSHAYQYLQIAEIYRAASRWDDALEWAERGLKAFPERTDSRLREFLAEEYHRRGRHDDAIALVWKEFTEAPHVEQYRGLKRHADRVDQWPTWRERALAHLRQRGEAARAEKTSRRGRGRFAWLAGGDHSTLVRIFLWERDVDSAWREAQAGGCSPQLWLELARKREKGHPEDALPIYQAQIEPTLARKNNDAYEEATELLRKVHRALNRLGREDEFASYLASVRAQHKAKRNFMKRLDAAKWTWVPPWADP